MIKAYNSTRHHTLEICSKLEVEDHVAQPTVFVSPPKWHLGHTTWFFEAFVLQKFYPTYKAFHESYAFLFNSYYNTLGRRTQRDHRGDMTRPVLSEVIAYRAHVDEHMNAFLESEYCTEAAKSLLEIGINHEQQHQELLWTDLKYILGNQPTFPAYDKGSSMESHPQNAAPSDWIRISEGIYEIGHDGKGFAYDNEKKRHKVWLDAYAISPALVTNGEYMEFLQDEGYTRHELWLDEGWAWVNEQGIRAPLHWHQIDGEWMDYRLAGLQELEAGNALAHVSHYEAAAFAEWKGMRLPSEAEWEVASPRFDWGQRWEHTSSAYTAYPGFEKAAGAVGEYNGKFMMNQMVLRGASCATSEGHSRSTYRNFFHPEMQWQFSGIRLATSNG